MHNSAEDQYKLRTLKRSTIAIASVILVEVSLGAAANSLAIISDGLHALLDALTTFALFVAIRASLKPPDEEHMYGHEKFESIGGLVGGIALTGVALFIMYEAILKILEGKSVAPGLELVGFGAIAYTFCIDFFRVGSFLKARKDESSPMKAGLLHAVADLSSTVIAFLGFGLATLGVWYKAPALQYGDSLASMVLSVLLTFLSVKLIWGSVMELSDAISKDVADKVRKEILNTKGVCACEDLKIRRAGSKTFVQAAVQIPDYLDLEKAQDLTSEIEARLEKSLGNTEVVIRTKPCEMHMPTEELVEKLATETTGVEGVHEVNTAYANGKLYVTLHIYVNPKLTVEEADDMAKNIEKKIEKSVRDVENVAVHIEPRAAGRRKGSMVNEDEISKAIHEAVGSSGVFRVRSIVTYVADHKRYVNIVCRFMKQISVEDAHRVASDIEEKVKKQFAETIVTVHTE